MAVNDNDSLRELARVTNPKLHKTYLLNPRIRRSIEDESKRGIVKWGEIDKTPGILLNAALEELGEAAHAINHDEGPEDAQHEIIETIGVLVRLYWMLEDSILEELGKNK